MLRRCQVSEKRQNVLVIDLTKPHSVKLSGEDPEGVFCEWSEGDVFRIQIDDEDPIRVCVTRVAYGDTLEGTTFVKQGMLEYDIPFRKGEDHG
jgi:hypothetical protein